VCMYVCYAMLLGTLVIRVMEGLHDQHFFFSQHRSLPSRSNCWNL